MKRDILLIEPAYRNKYPPLGLMKISTYHKMLGDNVIFFKGTSRELLEIKWDRIYITTLFSFHWSITAKTIQFYKRSVKKTKDFLIGGILATTMKEELENEFGVTPFAGLLDQPGMLDDNDIVIDELPPDYDILDTITYQYPTKDAYIGYTTRGCMNKCKYCAVPDLEPKYKEYISLNDKIKYINSMFGRKKDLLLMDNNILKSKFFDQIIDEIKELGFYKGAKSQPDNLFAVYHYRLKHNPQDEIIIEKTRAFLHDFIQNRLSNKPDKINALEGLMDKYELNSCPSEQFSEKLENCFSEINTIVEKYRNKAPRQNYIDFNQGVDARLLTEEKMARLAELNIRPLRIAYDSIKLTDIYVEKIRLAAKYGIHNLSNYVLYNYTDTPEDLYFRLDINVRLNEELGTKIFSFPMKYIPTNSKDRKYISYDYGWNPKFIRAIQVILNVTHGAVMPGAQFFHKAFGKDITEFNKILMMPEELIRERFRYEEDGTTQKWYDIYTRLLNTNSLAIDMIKMNNFDINSNNLTKEEQQLLNFYIKPRAI